MRDDDTMTAVDQLDPGDVATFEEFLPLDAIDDERSSGYAPSEAPPAEEALHDASGYGLAVPATEVVDVDAIERDLIMHAPVPVVGDDLDEGPVDVDDEHELAVDEYLDITTHSHDPAREHDWVTDDEAAATALARADEVPEPRHVGEFVCKRCFLVRSEALRVIGTSVCADCAVDE